MSGRDLSKLAEDLREKALNTPISKVLEVQGLSMIEAKKLRDDYFSDYPFNVGIWPTNDSSPGKAVVSSYEFYIQGGNVNA